MASGSATSSQHLKCVVCERRFPKYSELVKHAKKCSDFKYISCIICGLSFNLEANLHLHVLSEHDELRNSSNSSGLHCSLCDKKFARTAGLKAHLLMHRVDDLATCEFCSEEFQFYSQLKQHIANAHENLPQLPLKNCCKTCGLVFENKDDLNNHVGAHRKVKASLKLKRSRNKVLRKPTSSYRICPNCTKSFPTKNSLDRHMVIHTGERNFVCETCGKKFNQKGALNVHQAIHMEKRPYVCAFCGAGFAQNGNMRKHIIRVHPLILNAGQSSFKCPVCVCVFKNAQSLNSHFNRVHINELIPTVLNQITEESPATELEFQSNISLTSSRKQNSLNAAGGRVLISSTNESECAPRVEPSSTVSTGAGAASSFSTTGVASSINTSSAPSSVFNRGQWIPVIFSNRKRIYTCPYYCRHQTGKLSDMSRHLRVHTNERPYLCTVCGDAFKNRWHLTSHLAGKHQIAIGKPNNCPLCQKGFARMQALMQHMRFKHAGDRISCTICNKQFRSDKGYRNHAKTCATKLKSKNKISADDASDSFCPEEPIDLLPPSGPIKRKIRSHKCGTCARKFTTQQHLEVHVRIRHYNWKPYHCQLCVKSFGSKYNLDNHLQIHFGTKNAKCISCDRAFRTRSELLRHQHIHDHQRRFACPYCSKLFKTRTDAKRHIQRHDKEEILAMTVERVEQWEAERRQRNQNNILHNESQAIAAYQDPSFFMHANGYDVRTQMPPVAIQPMADFVLPQDVGIETETELSTPVAMQIANNSSLGPNWVSNDIESFNQSAEQLLNGFNRNFDANAQQVFTAIPDSESAYVDQLISAFDQRPGSDVPGVAFDVNGPLWSQVPTDILQLSPQSFAANSWAAPAAPSQQHQQYLQPEVVSVNTRKTDDSVVNKPNASLSRSHSMLNFQFCEHCGRAFHRLDLYREHLKRHEGVFHRCTQCSKLFKGRSELRRHISETHSTVKRRFQCENCPSTFTRAAALRKHKEKAHPINDTLTETVDSSLTNQPPVISNSMPVQNLSIASDSNIEENQELHEGNQMVQSKFARTCPVCGKTFQKRSDLSRHIRTHTGEKPFNCDICGKKFALKSTLNSHSKTHQTERQLMNCSICGASYSSMVALRLHQRTHTNENPLSCPFAQCDQTFRSSVHRKRHIDQFHRNTNDPNNINDQCPFVASNFQCRSKFALASSFQLEVLENGQIAISTLKLKKPQSAIVDFDSLKQLAAGKINITIEQCKLRINGESYVKDVIVPPEALLEFIRTNATISDLNSHDNDDLRKYVCEICNKRFNRPSHLQRHMVTHTGAKQFECDTCLKRFSQMSSLKQHNRNFHELPCL